MSSTYNTQSSAADNLVVTQSVEPQNPKKDPREQLAHDPAADQIVRRLMRQKNALKFCSLYFSGNTNGYKSEPDADLALCSIIAFAAGDDADLVDRIFRTSALYRSDWDRYDYGRRIIDTALARLRANKKIPSASATEAKASEKTLPPFIRSAKGRQSVSPPLLAKYIRETTPYILVRDDAKQGTLLYVYRDGVYKLFSEDMMFALIKQPIVDYDEELLAMSNVRECYNQLITDISYVQQDRLNADEDVINFQNGLLRVSASGLTLEPHTPTVLSTIQIPSIWTGRPEATPVFDAYMKTLTNGDIAVENFLMEFIGVVLSNVKGWRLKKALFMVGEGNTGKSQLKSLAEKLIGKGNFIGMDLGEMEARFGTGVLYQTRLAGSSDMSFISVDELKTFKQLTGGDNIFGEFKGKQGFGYVYNGMLWFCANRLPRFGGDDGRWVYDRMIIVRCSNVIPPEKQDKLLLDKLYAERAGIIYKAVLALQRVVARNFRFAEPEAAKAEKQTYLIDNNTALAFLNECMCQKSSPDAFSKPLTTTTIYRTYQRWCKDNSNRGYAKNAKEFRDIIARHQGKTFPEISMHTKTGSVYTDITLTQEAYNTFCIA